MKSFDVFHYIERHIGQKVLVVIERDFGFEGQLSAISKDPPGIWLSEATAAILRGTLANPLPQVVSREKKSDLFIHLNSVLRIEVIRSGE